MYQVYLIQKQVKLRRVFLQNLKHLNTKMYLVKQLLKLQKRNSKIMGITPAMPSGSSLKYMMAEMPERAFDVGIAEQHAVTFSAGLATQGCIPYCNIYSTFMQRAFDQVLHDTAYKIYMLYSV